MPEHVPSIVILISGTGSNLQAIVNACAEQAWKARVAAVISNRADAAGLRFAAGRGIACEVLDHREAASREDYDRELARRIDAHAPAAVVLAGFMRLLTPWFVQRYEGRLINVHPSLLPAFAGLHTHRRALEAGVKLHGATVHLVTPEVDAGPIVAQAAVPVLDDDTEASLAERVLEQEHRIYPPAVRALLEGRLQVRGQRVRVRDAAPGEGR
ncbi:MAG: phosphoribosylglycinamide formyltransferase [Betaproteobacteria bacterium]|nr:phosphoribosylglycinamide formyltransferase [Betaproteobacteria bacterium]MBU6511381.1 phosphoribosylglycinamide formyltransferase [Betaproteobacteria bacterium]MDE1955656.1 phosphoribosylglycinamide formyltransferase [Betaproteobacteria bacterium]MDE2153696.1 phosphoribosylglycinamide formyltransferase [Betaproteobacteria bacterium]MDE2478920.1 phosphoribosylglycinamide formyltransferase [Betaproteobacteria bacterium]